MPSAPRPPRDRRPRPRTRRLALLAAVATGATGLMVGPAPADATDRSDAVPSAAQAASAASLGAAPSAPSRGRGRWQVVDLGGGRFDVRWTSPTLLPTGSDRPTVVGQDLLVGPSTVGPDGRTVRARATAPTAPDPTSLDVLLSGDRLDEAGSDRAVGRRGPSAPDPVAPPTTPLDAPDPGERGPYAVVSDDYRLPPVKLAGMPEPVEMVGHVVEPAPGADTGPRPLVLFLHGRHSVCYDPDDPSAYARDWPCSGRFEEIPSHLGYRFVQRVLASQGYATVSVRVNGINAQDDRLPDAGAGARAEIVERHLDLWARTAAEHQVDLDQVVLVGHSRGGEGVDRASLQVPLSAPYTIAGQVLLAPTDFASHTAPYVPTVTVLPYCDGDVSDLQGQRFTDTARDPVPGDTALRSSVLVMGANHKFFNTEWTPGTAAAPSSDDWYGPADEPCGQASPERLSAAEQRGVGTAYVAGAVHLFTGDEAYLPMFDGSAVSVPSAGDADVRSHAIGGGRDVRRPGLGATPTRPRGGATVGLCVGRTSSGPVAVGDCLPTPRRVVTPHWLGGGDPAPPRSFLDLAWRRAGAVGGLRFDRPLDLREDRLELRTIVDPRGGDPVDVRVRVTDGSGGSATLVPEGGRTLRPLQAVPGATKLWARAVLVDASGASGVDLDDVRSVELVGGAGGGHVWVADVAAAPASLAPVPALRAPTVDVGDLTIPEGDPPGDRPVLRTARVPFTVTGEVTRPSRLVVLTDGPTADSRQRFTVEVAPGQTRGSVPVTYTADRLDSETTGAPFIGIWPLRGLATDDYLGSLTVRDDDPTPEVDVDVTRRVREGDPVVVTARLAEPVGYDSVLSLSAVGGPGPLLRGTDLPASWLRRQGITENLGRPLARLRVATSVLVRAGRTSGRIVVPTPRDGVAEGPERVTVEVRPSIGGGARTATVTVVDPG